ncbi:MAG: VCBS repeat-containing protein, partial [Proteobacteria bacterium]|nr:VCBS repeat-containing protein [Pseudomonadota bacterium]
MLLASPGVQFADMNGDGLADLVARLAPGPTDVHFFPNQGDGRWQHRLRLKKSPPYALEAPGVRLIDIDGDGLVDVMRTSA